MGHMVEGQGLLGGCQGAEFTAYEIHMGLTSAEGLVSPFLLESRSRQPVDSPEGVLDNDGLTLGTYFHGLFHNRVLRRSILEHVAAHKGLSLPIASDDIDQNAEYDKLAAVVRQHLDMGLVYRVTGLGWSGYPRTHPFHLSVGTLSLLRCPYVPLC